MNTRKLLVSILMLVSILLSACGPVATQAPTAIPPTIAIAPAQEGITFLSKTFDLPITFSYGSEWKIDSEVSSEVVLKYKNYDGEFLFINPKSAKVAGPAAPYTVIPFPDDFVNWIQTHGLFQVVKTQSVVVGGLSGTQIDADATSACGTKTEWFLVGAGGWNCGSGGHYRFTYLDDVNGERLLIMTVGYVSAQDFVLMTDASQKVLDTVVFSKPTTFSSSKLEIPMTLTYGSDWYSEGEFPDLFTLKIKGTGYAWELGFHLVNHAQIADPNSSATMPWPDDFVAYLQSNHYFEAGQPMPVTVGGVNGIQIDALVKNIGQKRTFIAMKSTDWLYLDDTEMYRFIMLDDNNGQRLLITMNAPPDGFSKATDLEQKVLDTVVFAQPTTFSPKTFNLITSVNFGSGWHVEEDLLHDLYLDNGQMPIVFNIVTAAQLVDPVGGNLMPFPDDFMSWIQSNPDFKTSELTQVTVGGINGVQIDATPNTNISKKEFGLSWNILTSDGDWRFILLDNVHGEHVLIFMIAPAGKTFSELPELQQEIQHILDSVVFG